MPKAPHRVRRKPTAVGVHIFAGGFTAGLKRAGFNILCHLEGGNYGVASAKLNWPRMPIHVGEESWPLDELAGRVDLVYGNPPCAPWSSAGISTTRGRDAWREDPRTDCWKQCFTVLEEVRPRAIAVESVTQAYSKGREMIDDFTETALGLGYSVKHVLMDAKWTGLPQSRRRFFLICHRPSLSLELGFDFTEPPTVGQVLSTVSDPGHVTDRKRNSCYRSIYLECLRETPPGGKLRNTFDQLHGDQEKNEQGKIAGRPGFLINRLHPDRVMGAFIGDVFIHPEEHRLLGINEMRALCGYPDWFELDGRPTLHAALLARAVLPPVGQWLGVAVRRAVDSRRGPRRQTVTLLDLRTPDNEPRDLTDLYNGRP